ncbi:MAG: sugar phosphate nucleotidyltransferase [archaeon]
MKVVIPVAGLSSRLRPTTHVTHKVLMSIAGKPIINHIIDEIEKSQKIDEVIFILGPMGEQVMDHMSKNYSFKKSYVYQKERRGDAHAILQTEHLIDGPFLIVYCDTAFKGKIELDEACAGNLVVAETDTPERFGIIEKKEYVTRIVEKPKNPPSNLALIGMYQINKHKELFEAIREIIRKDITLKGEYYLADALQMMVNKGEKFKTFTIEKWLDTGKVETLLSTHRELLKENNKKIETESKVIEPVFIDDDVIIENSEIGPYVTINKGAKITNSKIQDSIIDEKSTIEDSNLKESIIGKETSVKRFQGRLHIADHTTIDSQ